MPQATFDTGCFQVNSTEILLFGGFSSEPNTTVYTYKCVDPKSEGYFVENENQSHLPSADAMGGGPDPRKISSRLKSNDFFMINGVYIELPQ